LLSFSALAVLSPLLLPVMFILRFTGEREVFFRQERAGKSGKVFELVKFATMLKNSPNIGAGEITVRNDPRVLPVGRILRRSKINELPQLWNVLIGDMSLVGPRPMVTKTYEIYPSAAREKIATVRPGLTGVGSIFFRDEETFLESAQDPVKFYRSVIVPYKSELETWFVENNSFLLYARLIAVTAWVVVFPNSNLFTKFFPNTPRPPEALQRKNR
jgi:lipopolysaccharide/colanic/teichoic acid biosynthesis glycosyltransferase